MTIHWPAFTSSRMVHVFEGARTLEMPRDERDGPMHGDGRDVTGKAGFYCHTRLGVDARIIQYCESLLLVPGSQTRNVFQ